MNQPELNKYPIEAILNNPIAYANKIKIKDLEELILILKDYYYNSDTPLVPDNIYDQLEDVLKVRNPRSSVLIQVGAPSDGANVPLPFPMASQNKIKAGEGSAQKWLDKYPGPYVVSHKIDGISLGMIYEIEKNNRVRVQLLTRGNGVKGSDVSNIVQYMDLSPVGGIKLPKGVKNIALRGEAIIPKKIWGKYYANDNPNVRNFVSGAIGRARKDPIPQDLARVRLVAFNLVEPELPPKDQMIFLENSGFYVAPYRFVDKLTEKQLLTRLDLARKSGPYQIDGLVISQNIYQPPTTNNPKETIAFKSQSEEVAQTRVIKVIWRASKRLLLKPRVQIEPVFLSGGKLTYATGHYAKYIVDNEIGPGALVTIVRSGEVIPYIVEVNEPGEYPDLPDIPYEWDDDGLNIKVTKATDEVSHSILVHMAKTLEIDHLGPGTLKKLVDMGYNTPESVLNISLSELKEVPSLGKNAEKIYDSLVKLYDQGVTLSQLMDASSIFEIGIGSKILQLALDYYPDLLEMENDPKLVDKLISIKGIERKTAMKIVNGLPRFNKFFDQVPQIKIIDQDDSEISENTNTALYGMRVIFTGIRDKDLEKFITSSGGTVTSTVSKTHKNQVVVAKDPEGNSNKLNSARDLGVPIMSLTEFKNTF